MFPKSTPLSEPVKKRRPTGLCLTHKIRLDSTHKQRQYFVRAAGTHRFVWNWGLAEWNRQFEAGGKPNGMKLKKQFNLIYRAQFPWIWEVNRDCHSQPFADLQVAFGRFFKKLSRKPVFKKKGRDRASFYVANDQFLVGSDFVRLPVVGLVKTRESLRFKGKINSARVVEEAGHWYIYISVDLGGYSKTRTGNSVVGVDLGIKNLATLSDGEQIENLRPLRKSLKRLKRQQRSLSRKQKGSANRNKQRLVVARTHHRVRNIRRDTLHKLTTKLCRENQTVVIEDLHVKGMVKNHRLAQSLSDVGFGLFRTMLEYKAKIYGTKVVIADRFYPSSKTCSSCGIVKAKLALSERIFQCSCGFRLDRDLNAARNLEKLGQALPEVKPVELGKPGCEAGTKPHSFVGAS